MLASNSIPQLKWLSMLERGAEVSSFIQVEREVSSEDDTGVCHLEVYISGHVSFRHDIEAFMVAGVWATDRDGGNVELYDHEHAQAVANLIKAYFTEAGL